MKKGACLAYSHGFNIVEEGQQIRKDLTVVMVAPKCPGTEVREEYKRGFGVPTLDRRAPGERSQRRRPRHRQGLGGGDRRRSRGRARVELRRRGEERPHGRADHPVRHAADRLDPLLRPHGRTGHRSRLRQQVRPVRLGDHHRGAQVRRPHADAGSSEQPGEDQGLRAGRRAARPHAPALQEAPGRHHHRRLQHDHDEGLGRRRRESARLARRHQRYRLRADPGGLGRRSASRNTSIKRC